MPEQFVGVKPVEERLRFDTARLEAYLRPRLEHFRGPVRVEQFRGGQSNPTYRVCTPGRCYALRRKPPGRLLPSAHAVEREYRVISALHTVGFPVARPWLLCEDDSVIGTPFFVTDCVEGRVLWDQSLPDCTREERSAIWDELNRVIAWLHTIDYRAVGLDGYGKPGRYIARQIERWTQQYRASETERIEAMDRLIEWLPAHVPPGEETAIVHGDYRLDNVILHPSEPTIVAVLDWELSTLGHPLADFAYHCMSWHIPPGQFRGIAGLDLAALGIPSEARYIEAYCARTGRAGVERAHWDFYMAYNLFRIAAILQGIMKRVVDGTAASAHGADAGRRARPIAELGWARVEELERGSR